MRITNPQGFHMRPITAFAQRAAAFVCTVTVSRDDCCTVDGKSALGHADPACCRRRGSVLTVEVQGPDAPDALAALVALLAESNEGKPRASPAG